MLTVKLLQTTQKIEILGSESQVYKKWQTAAIIRKIFNSNLETGRIRSRVFQIVRESFFFIIYLFIFFIASETHTEKKNYTELIK